MPKIELGDGSLHLNFTEDRFPILLFPFVNFSNDLAPFHKPVTAKSQERNTYNVAVFITFHGKSFTKEISRLHVASTMGH
jgi:hypothetical protein